RHQEGVPFPRAALRLHQGIGEALIKHYGLGEPLLPPLRRVTLDIDRVPSLIVRKPQYLTAPDDGLGFAARLEAITAEGGPRYSVDDDLPGLGYSTIQRKPPAKPASRRIMGELKPEDLALRGRAYEHMFRKSLTEKPPAKHQALCPLVDLLELLFQRCDGLNLLRVQHTLSGTVMILVEEEL